MSKTGTIDSSQFVLNLQQSFKLALSMMLLYWLALWMNWDMPKYGGLAIALISLDTTGASLRKGILRMIGTTVGLAVGMLGLALFAQSGALTLLYHAFYLIIVGYFIQTSRYPYAWFVAGFLPTLVWATTYGKIDNAFHYATFRYLETSAGIVIYTLVSITFWPQKAGDKLKEQGQELWSGFRKLFQLYRHQLDKGELSSEAAVLRAKLAGKMAKLRGTLQAAYTDTPVVRAKKNDWESLRLNTRALSDAMELWQQCINDCRNLDMDHLLPQFRFVLKRVDQRLKRINELWQLRSTRDGIKKSDSDDALLEKLDWDLSEKSLAEISFVDRAALLSFLRQLNELNHISRELLHTMFLISGFSSLNKFKSSVLPQDPYQLSRWDPVRLMKGLMPAVCFIVAYFFWIYFDPPTGPSIPNMAATFGLMILLTPMNAQSIIFPILVAIGGVVAPVYFLLMPQLSTGTELLVFIYCFTFIIASIFTGRLSALRTIILVIFVMMTGISNQQSYSFEGLVNGALMMLIPLGIIAIVQALFNPLRPEQILLRTVCQFCHGCAQVISGFSLTGSSKQNKERRLRKRVYESLVMPAPGKLLATQKHLNFKLFPDNPPSKVQNLSNGLQNIVFRLQSVEIAHERLACHSTVIPGSLILMISQIQSFLQSTFKRWENFELKEEFENQQNQLSQMTRGLERQLEELKIDQGQIKNIEFVDADLYALIGTLRGLKEAMARTQVVINQINWSQWSKVRF